MDQDIAIRVDGLCKAFRLGLAEERHDTLFSSISHAVKAPLRNFRNLRSLDTAKGGEGADTLWALRDVSFDVKKGEVLGIIGRNGAGKSTLLKVLSRITAPTRGEIRMRGRVSSLLEVGTGFHPELTGRENIYMNGTILGMRKAEIDRKFDEIVDFSGVERFLDTPVKRYSSGQKVRLAFSVAAHLEPEILIVDEVLAVGDADFQRKCLGRMKQVAKGGERTVLFVSHNMAAVMNLCGRVVLLQGGRIVCDDEPKACVDLYISDKGVDNLFRTDSGSRSGSGVVQVENMTVLSNAVATGAPLELSIQLKNVSAIPGSRYDVAVSVISMHEEKLVQFYSRHMNRSFNLGESRDGIHLRVDNLPLAPGQYHLNLWVGSGAQTWDFLQNCMTLRVNEGSLEEGYTVEHRGYPVVIPTRWESIGPAEVFDAHGNLQESR